MNPRVFRVSVLKNSVSGESQEGVYSNVECNPDKLRLAMPVFSIQRDELFSPALSAPLMVPHARYEAFP